ncbi:FAD-dependent monooxygenase [Edaphosphingomonas haloaromaticamans]|nr:FAD-dependent monooxygenase [Sphingomonas haloaromaticamans]
MKSVIAPSVQSPPSMLKLHDFCNRASWVIDPARPFDPKDRSVLETRVRAAIGDRTTPFEIIDASVWSVNRLYAPEYRQGRVLCMGDAVHRHPPTNGLGQNTSIADAFNLAWKLKFVLDGKAGSSLLDTYSAERAPIGRQIVERANRTLFEMGAIPAAIGIVPGQSTEDRWERVLTLSDDTEEARARRAALDEAVKLQDFGFNAIGVELGYRYRVGARVDDGTPEPIPPGPSDICYQATTWPGARLPHAWIELGRRTVSTLDVVGHGRFVLLTGPGGGAPWRAAAEQARERTGVQITVHEIGTSHGMLRDPLLQWRAVREVSDNGAVLVRPDAHVAWRAATADQASKLPAVMAELLRL